MDRNIVYSVKKYVYEETDWMYDRDGTADKKRILLIRHFDSGNTYVNEEECAHGHNSDGLLIISRLNCDISTEN